LPDVVLEPGAVRFGILAAIASRRVLLDATGLAADTDRPTDVPERPALPDGEHFIASNNAPS
jgi:hypothetical protein